MSGAILVDRLESFFGETHQGVEKNPNAKLQQCLPLVTEQVQ